ncbi:MAG: hypothetical protein ACOYKE_11180, partial [Ferruginibacter sp.]
MKFLTCLLFTSFLFFTCTIDAQTFSATGTFPVSLSGATGSCASSGTTAPNVLPISVTGLGNLSSTNKLISVSVTLGECTSGTVNLNNVQFRLQSPSGICQGIYSGGLSSAAAGNHIINLVGTTTCLNNPNVNNTPTAGSAAYFSSNNGYFNAQFNGTGTDYNAYTGSADGEWKLIFSESTSFPPCLTAASLTFGNPTLISQNNNGDNCTDAIQWDGTSAICASTNGMTGSTLMPGSL